MNRTPTPTADALPAQVLPGADQHLTVISGDVSDAAALQAAMAQCEQLVHLAAVVDIAPPRDEQHRQAMIQTALDGTRMVLGK
jgi:nucleoside-diphosphate-sugar epimerase